MEEGKSHKGRVAKYVLACLGMSWQMDYPLNKFPMFGANGLRGP